jgi:hypothetical protein
MEGRERMTYSVISFRYGVLPQHKGALCLCKAN